jgi:hypothetical protein
MAEHVEYKYLKPKPGLNYRQLFVNGRIRAEILYRWVAETKRKRRPAPGHIQGKAALFGATEP